MLGWSAAMRIHCTQHVIFHWRKHQTYRINTTFVPGTAGFSAVANRIRPRPASATIASTEYGVSHRALNKGDSLPRCFWGISQHTPTHSLFAPYAPFWCDMLLTSDLFARYPPALPCLWFFCLRGRSTFTVVPRSNAHSLDCAFNFQPSFTYTHRCSLVFYSKHGYDHESLPTGLRRVRPQFRRVRQTHQQGSSQCRPSGNCWSVSILGEDWIA